MGIKGLTKEVKKIYDSILKKEAVVAEIAEKVHKQYSLSAQNLYRYLVLRSFDLRKLHDSLSELGISSIRSAEAYVLSNLTNVLKLLYLLQEKQWKGDHGMPIIGYKKSQKLLRKNTNQLFNENSKYTEIMVTLPETAATDIDLLRNLTLEGMRIARMNLGQGDLTLWKKMLANINQVKEETGENIKVYMDLCGPRFRTSEILMHSKKGKIREYIRLNIGDKLILTKRQTTGRQTTLSDKDDIIQYTEIGVKLPQIIDDLKIKDVVYFDDGMIKASVLSKTTDTAELEITHAYKSKLASNKGINLPNTELHLPSLTDSDIALLPFISEHADIVGYSFVRKPKDVKKLYTELAKIGDKNTGVVFKIENKEAFDNLPLILFEAMKRKKIGVMIARGDLAVEIGFERISEVQNEILWLCEAAHIPVIWATQVLENLAKTGVATRAEVSDASVSVQAECVMLNKGPYILDAVRTLKNIILKMQAHAVKKKSALRSLKVAKKALSKINQ
jgi:pyruvate kinase